MDFGIGTIAITIALIFITYRIGLINFAQTNMERVTGMTDRSLEVMDFTSREAHSRKLGKIQAKLNDKDITRGNSKDIKKLLKNAGRTTQAS